jgi:hypothetical protein
VKVSYLVHEVLLLSPSSNYLSPNCYHNLCAVNYTSTHVLAPNNRLLLVHKRRSVSHWPPASEIGMLLINFLLSRTLADRQHAVTMPRPCHGLEKSLSERHICGMAGERHGNGMVCLKPPLMFCRSRITAYQCNGTNVMHFSFNLLRIKGLYMFRALLAYPQEGLHKRHLLYSIACIRSQYCIASAYYAAPPVYFMILIAVLSTACTNIHIAVSPNVCLSVTSHKASSSSTSCPGS